jgi:Trk K+ transport system NAD-binding subunit
MRVSESDGDGRRSAEVMNAADEPLDGVSLHDATAELRHTGLRDAEIRRNDVLALGAAE